MRSPIFQTEKEATGPENRSKLLQCLTQPAGFAIRPTDQHNTMCRKEKIMRNTRGWIICTMLCMILSACAQLDRLPEENTTPVSQPLESRQEIIELSRLIEVLHNKTNMLEAKNKELESLHAALKHKNEKLDLEIKKRDAVIQIQENVIKLLDDPEKTIETGLKDEIQAKMAELEKTGKTVKHVFLNRELFIPGSFHLSENGKAKLLELADTVKNNDGQIIFVEGHTDDVPVGGALARQYPSNWEISTARASSVVRFLQEAGKIKPERLVVSGYGDTRPVDSNQTESGRQKNRRVEIILGPAL
jgi:chemotaxis protein MotB